MINMSNYAKLVLDSAKHMLPRRKLDNLGIIRLPSNMFKTVITYDDKLVVFLAKPFTKSLRNLYGENGCSVRAYVLEDGIEPFDIKWSDEPSMVYNYCSGETTNEVVALITAVMEYMGYDKFSYLNIDYDPIHVCDSIDINMDRVLKMYKDVQKGKKWK